MMYWIGVTFMWLMATFFGWAGLRLLRVRIDPQWSRADVKAMDRSIDLWLPYVDAHSVGLMKGDLRTLTSIRERIARHVPGEECGIDPLNPPKRPARARPTAADYSE